MNLCYRTQNENEEKTEADVNGLGAANYRQYVFLCEKLLGRVFSFIFRSIIDISMEELCLKFNLKGSYSSGLVLVIDSGSQNHSHA